MEVHQLVHVIGPVVTQFSHSGDVGRCPDLDSAAATPGAVRLLLRWPFAREVRRRRSIPGVSKGWRTVGGHQYLRWVTTGDETTAGAEYVVVLRAQSAARFLPVEGFSINLRAPGLALKQPFEYGRSVGGSAKATRRCRGNLSSRFAVEPDRSTRRLGSSLPSLAQLPPWRGSSPTCASGQLRYTSPTTPHLRKWSGSFLRSSFQTSEVALQMAA